MSRVDNSEAPKLELNVNLAPNDVDDGGSISLTQVGGLLKKRKMLVLAVTLTAFLLGVVASLVYLARIPYKGSAVALLTYAYVGAESGLDPNGLALDVDLIRSSYVIEQALQKINLTNKDITIEDIRSNVSIEGLVPKAEAEKIRIYNEMAEKDISKLELLLDVNYTPTEYLITLRAADKLSALSNTVLVDLLAAILNEYNDYFIKVYGDTYAFDTIAANFNQANYDYAQVVEILNGQVNDMINYCTVKRDSARDFRSPNTDRNFGEIIASLQLIKNVEINRISAVVYASDMSRDLDRLKILYEYRIIEATNSMNVALENARAATQAAQTYIKDSAIVMGSTGEMQEVTLSSEVYDSFMRNAMEHSQRANQLREQITFDKQRLAALKGEDIPVDPNNPELGFLESPIHEATPDDIQFVEDAIPGIVSALREWSDIVEETAKDYFELEFFKDATKISLQAHYQSAIMEHIKIILIIIAGATFAGLFLVVLAMVWKSAFAERLS